MSDGSTYVESDLWSHPSTYEAYDYYRTDRDGEPDKHPSARYISGPHALTTIDYRLSPGRHRAHYEVVHEIDRSTGVLTYSMIGQSGVISQSTSECELRPENKF